MCDAAPWSTRMATSDIRERALRWLTVLIAVQGIGVVALLASRSGRLPSTTGHVIFGLAAAFTLVWALVGARLVAVGRSRSGNLALDKRARRGACVAGGIVALGQLVNRLGDLRSAESFGGGLVQFLSATVFALLVGLQFAIAMACLIVVMAGWRQNRNA